MVIGRFADPVFYAADHGGTDATYGSHMARRPLRPCSCGRWHLVGGGERDERRRHRGSHHGDDCACSHLD